MKIKIFSAVLMLSCSAAYGPAFAFTDSEAQAVIDNYANIAEAKYADSLTTAKALDASIRARGASRSPMLSAL